MSMTQRLVALAVGAAAGALSIAVAVETDGLVPSESEPYAADTLARLRAAADDVPGRAPLELRYVTVAESHRPLSVVLSGGDDTPYVQARTAFQIVYADGTIMVDAGMDEAIHRTFGQGAEEPYFPDRNAAVQRALLDANLVVVTHEHGDHVAGVIRSDNRERIAAHTLLTRAQVHTLALAPQRPGLKLTPEMADDYMIVDYALAHALAPGVVLLKAPGHTPGHQMVYVRLAGGEELLLAGDASWAWAGIAERRQRPRATSERIREDRTALDWQLAWLSTLIDDGVVVVPSHDSAYLDDLTSRELIAPGLIER